MRIPTRAREHGLAFNITPLIDVVFLLIIFFLAASHLVRSESQEAVELPLASETEDDEDRTPRHLVITITADRETLVGGETVDLPGIEQMILAGRLDGGDNAFEVRIRGDKSVPYRDIEPIMLACARSGVTSIGYAVLQK